MESFDVHIDPVGNRLDFGRHLCLPKSIEAPADLFLRLTMMELKVDGDVIPLLFDTGAKISYIDPDYVDGMTPLAERENFYPTLGRFTTPVYELSVLVGGQKSET